MAKENDVVEEVNVETGEVNERKTFQPSVYSTIDLSLPINRIKVFNAHNSSISLKDVGETPFNIVGVMTEEGERANSKNPCQNTYIFTDDDTVLFSQSNGIAKTINELVAIVDGNFAENTTNGYVTARVKSRDIGGNRTYKNLELLDI